METPICSACGCSLVRLGIGKEQAVPHVHEGQEHHFCCQGCRDLFIAEPQKYLRLTDGVIVCPNCLGEKPPDRLATFAHAGADVPYCGCRTARRCSGRTLIFTFSGWTARYRLTRNVAG